MNYRLNEIMGVTTYEADKTEVINIDQADPISELIIALTVNCTGMGNRVLHETACLKKIELMDGSKPLVSLSGLQAEAIDWYSHKAFRHANWNVAINDNSMLRYIGINFGRWLWDEKYAFDPKRFTNPQLKLTIDVNAGGDTATSDTLAVYANSFDKKVISPAGFLGCVNVADKPLAVSSHIYYDLPVDQTLRRLFYRAQRAGKEPNQMVWGLRLGENGYKVVVFDLYTDEITAMTLADYPRVTEEYLFTIAPANRYLMVAPSAKVMATGTPWSTSAATRNIALYDGDGGRLKTIASLDTQAQIAVAGIYPHCLFCVPFGDLKDDNDWYKMEGISKLQLDVLTTAGALTTDTGELVVEEVIPY
jgi:hypothetical protein